MKLNKLMKLIKKIFIGIAAVIYFSFVIAITILLLNFNDYGITELDTTSVIIMKEDIEFTPYKKGDIVLVERQRIDKLDIADEVFVYKIDKNQKYTIEIGIIGNIHSEDDAVTFENGDTYAMEFVIGIADKVYPKYGTYLSIIESTWGFLFIVLVPSFLIFIYELYALIIEIKYGKEEEKEE